MSTKSNTVLYFVAYVKLVIPGHGKKPEGGIRNLPTRIAIKDNTVLLGSIGLPTFEEAEAQAKQVVNNTARSSSCTILPRVFELDLNRYYEVNPLYDAMCRALDWFEKKLEEMNEVVSIDPKWRKVW